MPAPLRPGWALHDVNLRAPGSGLARPIGGRGGRGMGRGGLGRAVEGPSLSTGRAVGVMHGRGMGMDGSSTGINGAGGAGGGTGRVNRAVTPPPGFTVDRNAATGLGSIGRASVSPPPGFPVERRQQQGSVPGWSQLQHCVIGMALYLSWPVARPVTGLQPAGCHYCKWLWKQP